MLEQITPLIITFNEEANIQRTLAKLTWARRIVVLDSGSTDQTLELLRSYPQVAVIHHEFNDFASQCNFGLSQVTTPWVLSLDADYELSEELVTELRGLAPASTTVGYRTRFVYRIYGRPLRGTLYPPRTVLYRKKDARYRNEGHGHRLEIAGNVIDLKGPTFHDDRKPLSRWLNSQQRYASDEAIYLLETPSTELSRSDKLRLMVWPAPFLIFFYTLFVKRCILDGTPGLHYALQRLYAEVLVAVEIVDQRLRGRGRGN